MMISLLKNDLKQLKNTVVIFSGFLALSLVISLISFHSDVPVGMFYLIILLYSLVVPMVNLSYLFDQTQQTHFSSLPYTKIQSFMIRYLSGLLCIIIPVIIYCIVDVILGQGLVLKNCSSAILMIWIYYSLGNLAAYLTTSVIMDIILQIVINISPFIIYMSLFSVYQTFVRGIISADFSMEVVSIILPAFRLFIGGLSGLSSYYLLLYAGYGLVIFIMAFLASSNRECVNNYHGFTYKIICEVIKLICIISVSWLITSILDIPVQSLKSFIIINIIATFVATFIIQFIQSKRIRYVLCIVQGTLIVLVTIVIFIGSKGYLENYIPHDIKAVEINSNFGYNKINSKLTDQKSIDTVVAIHQEILKQKSDYGSHNLKITYYKDNGDKVTRGYEISDQEYLMVIKKLDAALLKSWFDNYYYIINKLDTYQYLTYALPGESENEIRTENDILLFKNILQRKLSEFENNPNLLLKVDYDNPGQITRFKRSNDGSESYQGDSISFDDNDPMSLALQEYDKIKAN